MADQLKTKVLVVGGGPGGYVAAIRAGQLGLDTTLVEADALGGTCLTRGCIPSKAIIHAAETYHSMIRKAGEGEMGISLSTHPVLNLSQTVQWKDCIVRKLNTGVGGLLRHAHVRHIKGWAAFSDAKNCTVEGESGSVRITAEHVILATGSEATQLPSVPFGGPVISSTEALSLEELPKDLVVVGAGYIGLELGIAFCKLGSRVTVVEAVDRILPLYDRQLTDPVRKWMEGHGVTVHLNSKLLGVESSSDSRTSVSISREGEVSKIPADKILVAVGRRPVTRGWGLENMGVDMERGFVKIDRQCRTSMKNVWAIGDLAGEPMLAHKASAQGEMVAEIIFGPAPRVRAQGYTGRVFFTEPEVLSVGALPDEAAAEGAEIITGLFPLAANGRALTMQAGDDKGFVRVVARRDNHRVLGIQAVGAHISELSGEFAHALEMDAVLEDVALTIHAHPTLSEAFHEAALKTLGHAIHI